MSKKMSRRSFLALGALSPFTAAAGFGCGMFAHSFKLPEENSSEDEKLEVTEEERIEELMREYKVPSIDSARELNKAIQFEQALCAGLGGAIVPFMHAVLPSKGFMRYSARITASGSSAALTTYPFNALDEIIRSTKINPNLLQSYYGLPEEQSYALYEKHKQSLIQYAGITASLFAVMSPS